MTEVTYPSYRALDELLGLQRLRSEPEHPAELLFIVVHQSSELWFKVIIQQLEAVLTDLETGDGDRALWRVQRINGLMRIVADQLSALDTLPPQRFLQFRGVLGASSGQQSLQFRLIGALSGMRDDAFVSALKVTGEIPSAVAARSRRCTRTRGPTRCSFLPRRCSITTRRFQRWRFLHVQLVERIIGPVTGGTGGSMGARHLAQSVNLRFFPQLWAVRAQLFGGS